jgi:hypothetical protein
MEQHPRVGYDSLAKADPVELGGHHQKRISHAGAAAKYWPTTSTFRCWESVIQSAAVDSLPADRQQHCDKSTSAEHQHDDGPERK